MKDRIVEHPNRYRMVPVAGQDGVFDMVPVPGMITEPGTLINKASLLSDEVAAEYELSGDDATVNKALEKAATKKALEETITNLHNLNGATVKLPVADGETITAGDFTRITNGKISGKSDIVTGHDVKVPVSTQVPEAICITLADDMVVFIYYDKLNSYINSCAAKLYQVVGTELRELSKATWRPVYDPSLQACYNFSAVKLTDSKIAVAYSRFYSPSPGPAIMEAIILDVIGTSLVSRYTTTLYNNPCSTMRCERLSDTKFVVYYVDSSAGNSLRMGVCNVSGGTNITANTAIVLNASSSSAYALQRTLNIFAISETVLFATYCAGGAVTLLKITLLSDITASLLTQAQMETTTYEVGLVKLGSNTFMMGYNPKPYGRFAAYIVIVGTNIAVGTYNFPFGNGKTLNYLQMGKLKDGRVVVTGNYSGNEIFISTPEGSTITFSGSYMVAGSWGTLQAQNLAVFSSKDLVFFCSTTSSIASLHQISVMPTECIAITSGNSNEIITAMFDGVAKVEGIDKGKSIRNVSGVSAYAYLDNMLSIKGYWK